MASIPDERSLVQKMKGRPFALIGINMGEEGGDVMAKIKQFEMSWPSFASDEDQGTPAIADSLEIESAGYVMLVDARGVIRYKGPETLLDAEHEIEALVQEAENQNGSK